MWNETLEIPIESLEERVKLICYDEDMIMDEAVGEEIFTFKEVLDKSAGGCIQLKHKGKLAAELFFSAKFIKAAE